MAAPPLTLTAGDLLPDLTGICGNGNTPANLTGAALEIHVYRPGMPTLIRPGTILSATDGTWTMPWQVGDLAADKWLTYQVEVQVTFASGKPQTFGPQNVRVKPQLA